MFIRITDATEGGVGGAATTPAAPVVETKPAPELRPVMPAKEVAPTPPVQQPAAPVAATPGAPFDMTAFMAQLAAQNKAQQAENDARIAMLVKTAIAEQALGKAAEKRPVGRPAAPAKPEAPATPANPANPTAPAQETAAESLENQALKTKIAELEALSAKFTEALEVAQREKTEAATAAHQAKVRASVEKILTSSSIGMSPDSATAAAEVVLDLKRYVQEDKNSGDLFVKFTDDTGKEVVKPLLEGLSAWANTRAGKVFKPPIGQGSGAGRNIVADRYAAAGKTPPPARVQASPNGFQEAWSQQKAGQTTR